MEFAGDSVLFERVIGQNSLESLVQVSLKS